MLVKVAVAMVALALVWGARTDAAPSAFKVCGRKLSEIMAHLCRAYNSPSWDAPAVVEQPTTALRRRRQTGGIADDCCTNGCTWEQLSEYCSEMSEEHVLEHRSVEEEEASSSAEEKTEATPPVVVAEEKASETAADDYGAGAGRRREVGSARSGGYGRARGRRRCGCRRRRRSGRRRASLMGNMNLVKNVNRPPIIGTVPPLLDWGLVQTINTDLPQLERDRYSYVAVYST